jgi:putative methyltransferase (TIGR04325 family)
MRRILHDFLPPALVRLYRNISVKEGFFGNYASWTDAASASGGYDSDLILTKVKDALLKVKSGAAVYERDSVLFDTIEYSWPLLAGLLWVASRNDNRLNLVDFGGSLGSTYYQNRRFLKHLHELHWNVVEQERFVEYGRRYFENDELSFYRDLDECCGEKQPMAILLSSVIQYMENPYALLEKVMSAGFDVIIIDRTPFLGKGGDRITVQKVPAEIYEASYPAWFFNREKFLRFFSGRYDLVAEFESLDRANIPSQYKGFIFERISSKNVGQ